MPSHKSDMRPNRRIKNGPNVFEWIRSQALVLRHHLAELDSARKVIDSMEDVAERTKAIVVVRTAIGDLCNLRYDLDRTIDEYTRHFDLR